MKTVLVCLLETVDRVNYLVLDGDFSEFDGWTGFQFPDKLLNAVADSKSDWLVKFPTEEVRNGAEVITCVIQLDWV